jgi:excisionase family DNA binding protein
MNQQEEALVRLTREEASKALRMSLGTLDKRISEGALSVVRDGKRVFILQEELNRYLRGE